MKKISILLAFSVFFGGLVYAAPRVMQQKTSNKKEEKKTDKKEIKKVPTKKKQDKKNQ